MKFLLAAVPALELEPMPRRNLSFLRRVAPADIEIKETRAEADCLKLKFRM
jgi:hypothetical protein